mmetsp:Transcript_17817/g.18567  ORF Transcript_17817/g.18567 Transcript_17817/m.18567 type:complete len:123 (-) Transcript_17817:20-388(-)
MAQGRPTSPQSSSNIRGTEGSDGDYLMMEELDEENINWGKLLTRAFCILLLLIIIVCAAVGAIYERLYYLAILVAIALVCVFGLSFLDLEVCKTRTVEVFRMTREQLGALRHESHATNNDHF